MYVHSRSRRPVSFSKSTRRVRIIIIIIMLSWKEKEKNHNFRVPSAGHYLNRYITMQIARHYTHTHTDKKYT